MLRPLWLALCALLLLIGPAAALQLQTGTVTWVYDGDTLQVEPIGKVRLLGIDTPESKDSQRDNYYRSRYQLSRKRLRQIARQAKEFNIEQTKGKPVQLQFDGDKTDKYQRKLAYLYLPNGHMLNRILLEKGLASVFRRYDFTYKDDFISLEQAARTKRLGLWRP